MVSGGLDLGFHAMKETRICTTCRHMEDDRIGLVSDPAHHTSKAEEHEAAADPEPPCSDCGGVTAPWDRTCPLCGSPMREGQALERWD